MRVGLDQRRGAEIFAEFAIINGYDFICKDRKSVV